MGNWVEKVSTDEQEDTEPDCLERMLISSEMELIDLIRIVKNRSKQDTLQLEVDTAALFNKLQKAIEELK